MKTRSRKCKLVLWQPRFSIWAITVLFIIMFNVSQTFAQNATSADFATSVSATADATRKLFGGKITNNGYGGPAIKFSRFNDQFAFMTGGRGAFTINNRYTIGGGGYGIANIIQLSASNPDTSSYFKMGYGGLEFGYIFSPGKKVNIGGSLLVAVGAAFRQNKPKNNGEKLFDDDFNIFPVLESSLYSEIALNRFIWLQTGFSYRYVYHANLDYISDQNIRGFSFYIDLLFGKSQ
ncbi:MAG: hypothetical protein EPN88_16835 [Bacteroidetes bacterium]|nr:MAG: hypothetical protein EPN88_16835 [Bacteroidota bacterium]